MFIFLFANFLAPVIVTDDVLVSAQPWASWVLAAIAFVGPLPYHLPKVLKLVSRNRLLWSYVDREYPTSTDLSDAIWRRYHAG